MKDRIDRFLQAKQFAVVGASKNRAKYGNKVLRCYVQNDRQVVAVNPKESEIEGLPCFHSLTDVSDVEAISIITPPTVTEKVVRVAQEKGVQHVWMQPGAESEAAIQFCEDNGMNVIGDGSCLLVVLGYKEH